MVENSKCEHPKDQLVKNGHDMKGKQTFYCKKCRRFFKK